MHIKIITSIVGLILPWFPAPTPETSPEAPAPLVSNHKIEPLKELDLKPKEPLVPVPQAPAAPANNQPAEPVHTPSPTPVGDAKTFIYNHESGNNPLARNAIGCLGLGQACPGSKLLAVCPTLEYACEDSYFTSYMSSRYGSWENARAFWLAHGWW